MRLVRPYRVYAYHDKAKDLECRNGSDLESSL